MADLTARLDEMETAIRKPSFRQSSGRDNEVNYWVFDYPPERELEAVSYTHLTLPTIEP